LTGVNGCNVWESLEVANIQRENVCKAIRLHDRYEASVMHLHTANAVSNHQLAPNDVNLLVVRQEGHRVLDEFKQEVGFADGQAIAVSLRRSRRNIPELSDVLDGEMELNTSPFQSVERRMDGLVRGVV